MPGLNTLKWFLGTRGMVFGACAAAIYAQPFRPIVFVGQSMTPTYANGEMTVTVPFDGKAKRGDIVVIERDGETIVKRVAMVPGDPILQVRTLFGEWRDAFCMEQNRPHKRGRVRNAVVPDGVVYVLGDNLPGSTDSRSFGPVQLSQITRKVYQPRPGGPGEEFVAVKTYRQMRTW
jgi:signal peptidase I